MSIHRVHVFVSHSWSYSQHYKRIRGWLFDSPSRFGQARVEFKDYSIPRDDPIPNAASARALKKAIFRHIARCHVVVVPTGMYASRSKWIKEELACAKAYSKPILAVNPWRQERKSAVALDAAHKTVGWNRNSVVRAVWKLYYPKSAIP